MWFVIASLALLASVATSALDPHDPRPRVAMVMAIGLLFALFSLVVFIWLAFTTSYSLDPRPCGRIDSGIGLKIPEAISM